MAIIFDESGDICPFPPGTQEKIDWMKARHDKNLSCFHYLDATWENSGINPGEIAKPAKDPGEDRGKPGLTGVEKMQTGWRARPYWQGKRYNLGTFPTIGEATRQVELFWVRTLGLFACARNTASSWMPEKKRKKKRKRREPK